MPNSSTPKHLRNFAVSLANEQSRHSIDEQRVIEAARAVLAESRFDSAMISLAVVDDATIHELNRRHLGHDWPTDVLSFTLEERANYLSGEVIISADMAASAAAEVGWPPAAEQLLYVIHGMLHLVGYGDKTPAEVRTMREAEAKYLEKFGYNPPCRISDGERVTAEIRTDKRQKGTKGP